MSPLTISRKSFLGIGNCHGARGVCKYIPTNVRTDGLMIRPLHRSTTSSNEQVQAEQQSLEHVRGIKKSTIQPAPAVLKSLAQIMSGLINFKRKTFLSFET